MCIRDSPTSSSVDIFFKLCAIDNERDLDSNAHGPAIKTKGLLFDISILPILIELNMNLLFKIYAQTVHLQLVQYYHLF